MPAVWIAVLVAAYLLGTLPVAVVVAGRAGHDVLSAGSGNPGASNAYRVAGKRVGALVLLGDLLKGAAATALGYAVDGRPLALAAGAVAVVGHCLPATRGFKGGKGVATAAGLTFVMYPFVALACAVAWFVTARLVRTASLASAAAALTLLIGVFAFGRPLWEMIGVLAIAAFVLTRHRSNFARLAKGQEEVIP